MYSLGFGITIKLVWLIKMDLNEGYSKARMYKEKPVYTSMWKQTATGDKEIYS